jgi:mono/diheme cytochrome c family protein
MLGSHLTGFGLWMLGQPKRLEEMRVFRRFAPAIGLLLGLAPAMAYAQTNIDQGKTPAQMYASDCAVCHKTSRGLANGRNSILLAGFLREHYTSSQQAAASMAAYVLGAGGAEGAPAAVQGAPAGGRGQKPDTGRAAAVPAEEHKPTRQAKQPAKP